MVDSKKRPGKDLDRIDRNILNELQKDGRISNVELSKRVGLSPTPCLERVRRLERQGFIQGYTALLNPHYLDASLLVFVEITLIVVRRMCLSNLTPLYKNLKKFKSVTWYPVISTTC